VAGGGGRAVTPFAVALSALQTSGAFPSGLSRPETAPAPGPALPLGNQSGSWGCITAAPGLRVLLLQGVCGVSLQEAAGPRQ